MLHGTLTKPVTTRHPKACCYMALLSPLLHSTLNLIATQHPLQSLQLHDTLYKVCFYTAPITQPVTKRHLLQSPLLHGTIKSPSTILGNILSKAQVLFLAIFYQKPKYYFGKILQKLKYYRNLKAQVLSLEIFYQKPKYYFSKKFQKPKYYFVNILQKPNTILTTFYQQPKTINFLTNNYFIKPKYYQAKKYYIMLKAQS